MIFQIGFKLVFREFNLELCYRLVIKITKQNNEETMIGDHYIRLATRWKIIKTKKNYFLPLFNVVGYQTKVKSYFYKYIYIFFLNLTCIIFLTKVKTWAPIIKKNFNKYLNYLQLFTFTLFTYNYYITSGYQNVRIESLVLKLTLTQYNQNPYRINFIEFIIALTRYALFRRLSPK